MKPVLAWAGLCDDSLYFSRQKDNYSSGSAVVAEVYRSQKEAKERYRHVIRVEIREVKKRKPKTEEEHKNDRNGGRMYGSDHDPLYADPKTHAFVACCCGNQERHCWYCGKTEEEHETK